MEFRAPFAMWRNGRTYCLVLAIAFVALLCEADGATFTSSCKDSQAGAECHCAWNDACTWDGGAVPPADTDDVHVVIGEGATVVSSGTEDIIVLGGDSSITVEKSATLALATTLRIGDVGTLDTATNSSVTITELDSVGKLTLHVAGEFNAIALSLNASSPATVTAAPGSKLTVFTMVIGRHATVELVCDADAKCDVGKYGIALETYSRLETTLPAAGASFRMPTLRVRPSAQFSLVAAAHTDVTIGSAMGDMHALMHVDVAGTFSFGSLEGISDDLRLNVTVRESARGTVSTFLPGDMSHATLDVAGHVSVPLYGQINSGRFGDGSPVTCSFDLHVRETGTLSVVATGASFSMSSCASVVTVEAGGTLETNAIAVTQTPAPSFTLTVAGHVQSGQLVLTYEGKGGVVLDVLAGGVLSFDEHPDTEDSGDTIEVHVAAGGRIDVAQPCPNHKATNFLCQDCNPGFYGPECRECICAGDQHCDDGPQGTGKCSGGGGDNAHLGITIAAVIIVVSGVIGVVVLGIWWRRRRRMRQQQFPQLVNPQPPARYVE